jgi:hypothetical protein
MRELEIDADVVEVRLPATEHCPAVHVHVNEDALVLEDQDGRRIAVWEYVPALLDAEAEEDHGQSTAEFLYRL